MFGYLFLAEFIVRLYSAESPSSHLRKTLTLIDIFTIFPPYLGILLFEVTKAISAQFAAVDTTVSGEWL